MGNKLDKLRKDNFENMKIGFLLELDFRQNSINSQLDNFIEFIEDNKEFLNAVDLPCITDGIENFSNLFYNFTDLIYKDVDINEKYRKYNKKFY